MQRWKRTYWAVWWSNLVVSIGMGSFLPFFPTHVERLGVTDLDEIALWSGILYGAAPLSAAITGPWWGAIGDRYGRKLMVLRSMAAVTVFVGLMAFARDPWQLLVLRLVQGVFSGFAAPSITLVSVAAPPDQQGRVAGSLQTAMAAGGVLGPAIGGLAGAWIGLENVFLAVAAASIVGFALVALFAHEDPAHRIARDEDASFTKVMTGSFADLRDVWAVAPLRAGLVVAFWTQFGLSTTNPIVELYVREFFPPLDERVPLATSLCFSGMALVHLVAMPLWGRRGDRIGHGRALGECAAWTGASLAAHALVPVYSALLALRLVFGAAIAGSGPCAFGLAATEVPVEKRGGAFGVVFAARTLSVALAAFVGGLASRWLGIRGLYVVSGLIVLWAAIAMQRAVKQRERAQGPAD